MSNNTFTNASGDTWSTPSNWSMGTTPDSNASVSFASGTYTSVVDGGPWTIQSLNVNVATVTLQVDVDLTTQTLDNAGAIQVEAGATLTTSSLNSNSGTITVSDSGILTVQNVNGNSGTIVAASDGLVNLLGNGAGNFAVIGGVLKIAGNYNGSGTIETNGGTIWVAGQLGSSAYNLGADGGDQAYFDALQPTTTNSFTGVLPGDLLGIKGVTINSATYVGTTLTLDTSGGSFAFTNMNLASNEIPAAVTGTTTFEGNSYGFIELACFAEGTRIDTLHGPMAVEALRPGMLVLTAGGEARPIRWIGFRQVEPSCHPEPAIVWPICILADAFAPGMPRRAVRLSPDHAVLVNGSLVPVRLLVNGASIVQDDACRSLTYYHVELDSHDILLAEGLPAESYLDTGNRGMFENTDADFDGGSNDQALREALSCVALVAEPEQVRPLWYALARRAVSIGYVLPQQMTTDEPALCLETHGERLMPTWLTGSVCSFDLADTQGPARLISHATAPSALQPWTEDRRRLGVMVRRLTLHRGGEITSIPLDHPAMKQGWWAMEGDEGTRWRWTNGAAEIPLDPGGPARLELEYGTMRAYMADA